MTKSRLIYLDKIISLKGSKIIDKALIFNNNNIQGK